LNPVVVQINDSSHIIVSDLTFINSPWFTVAPYRSEYVTIDHVTVKNPSNAPNTDGIHPEACHHVVISNCFVSTGDDGIVITSETDKNTNAKYSSENITVNHCTVHSGHGGIVIGSAISGDVRDIHAHNLHFEGTLRGVRLKSTRDHGGIVENIYIKDITMKNISDEGITISAFYDVKNFDPHNIPSKTFDVSKTPTFRNIHLTNVTGDSKLGLQIVGLPEKHFDKIELKQVHLVAKKEEIIVNADHVLKENFIYKIDKHLHDN
ncbi:PREDICTED: probable polygalacturonase, partial [Rhagoletis zephyria]|uniref:probable polygalacturonase n=1 Tax=Rhagoletis zephyria TaxID=28612 RepID=UPI0008119FB8